MFHAGYQRFSKIVRLYYKSNTVYSVQNKIIYTQTNANESCVCEVGRHWKILLKIKVCRSKFSYVLLTQYCSGDHIEKNEMAWTCSTYEGEDRCVQGFDMDMSYGRWVSKIWCVSTRVRAHLSARTLIVTNDLTRPLLCEPITCYVTVITHAYWLCVRITCYVTVSVLAWQCNL
jgi:hypothetical protein